MKRVEKIVLRAVVQLWASVLQHRRSRNARSSEARRQYPGTRVPGTRVPVYPGTRGTGERCSPRNSDWQNERGTASRRNAVRNPLRFCREYMFKSIRVGGVRRQQGIVCNHGYRGATELVPCKERVAICNVQEPAGCFSTPVKQRRYFRPVLNQASRLNLVNGT
eukprot:1987838-Rhodomonas_salina.1